MQARLLVASHPLQNWPPNCTQAEPGGKLSAAQSALVLQAWQCTVGLKPSRLPQKGAPLVVTRQVACSSVGVQMASIGSTTVQRLRCTEQLPAKGGGGGGGGGV